MAVQLWVRSGGRCEFKGCNQPLWQDDLTLTEMNRAYIAHIVADTPTGPRGDPILSPLLGKDIGNLMLLCATHHKLVDVDDIASYPVDRLKVFKREHEQRIEYLTGLDEQAKTQVLILRDNVADRRPTISSKEAHWAILPRYPATPHPIEFNFTDSPYRDHEAGYFSRAQDEVSRLIEKHIRRRGPRDEIEHLSIFGLASMPLLIHFGYELGETIPSAVYDFHRNTNSWAWQEPGSEPEEYEVVEPTQVEPAAQKHVVLNLSLSDTVPVDAIAGAINGVSYVYTVRVRHPAPDVLRTREQLALFVDVMRRLISRIREVHGTNCHVHLFPAIPACAAIRLGQIWNPKCCPILHTYEYNQWHGGFFHALTIPRVTT